MKLRRLGKGAVSRSHFLKVRADKKTLAETKGESQ